MQTTKKRLTVKDLVTVGIFSALFLVFALVGGIFFAPNPVLTFYMPVGSALLRGPVSLLIRAARHHRLCAYLRIHRLVHRRAARHMADNVRGVSRLST